jgi:hypothetical protein
VIYKKNLEIKEHFKLGGALFRLLYFTLEQGFLMSDPQDQQHCHSRDCVRKQVLWLHPIPIESETLGMGAKNLCFRKPSR